MPTANINAVRIAKSLHQSEHAIDEAILQTSDYMMRLIQGRREHALAAEVGQDAVAASARAILLMTEAREAQIVSHVAIKKVADFVDVGWRMAGPTEKKIDPPSASAAA